MKHYNIAHWTAISMRIYHSVHSRVINVCMCGPMFQQGIYIREYKKWDAMRLAIECRVYLRLFGMLNNTICRHITLYTTLLLWTSARHRENDPFLFVYYEDENTEKKLPTKKKTNHNNKTSMQSNITSSPTLKANQHTYKFQYVLLFSSFNKSNSDSVGLKAVTTHNAMRLLFGRT